jgi:hypothetical protein
MSNQPSRKTQIDKFYTDAQIEGKPISAPGEGFLPGSEANRNPSYHEVSTPGLPSMTRKGYSSDYPSRMRNGKPGA